MEVGRAPSASEAPEHAARIQALQQLLREGSRGKRPNVIVVSACLVAAAGAAMFAAALLIVLAPDSGASRLLLALLS